VEDHDRGLAFDLQTLSRRKMLALLAGVTLVGLTTRLHAGPPGPQRRALPGAIPEETAGPFPADGSNRYNVLGESGLLRSDLRSSFGQLRGTAPGDPLRVELQLVDRLTGRPLPGHVLYLWHCDRDGKYSLYEIKDQNYLRGVQVADADGMVRFDTIFPGCYDGRWPHMHFEVFRHLAAVTGSQNALSTSQLALPENICRKLYARPDYAANLKNLNRQSLSQDMIFADSIQQQMAQWHEDKRITLKVPV
jgi:protocatechuate 3,4-dioxygenase beta subunit